MKLESIKSTSFIFPVFLGRFWSFYIFVPRSFIYEIRRYEPFGQKCNNCTHTVCACNECSTIDKYMNKMMLSLNKMMMMLMMMMMMMMTTTTMITTTMVTTKMARRMIFNVSIGILFFLRNWLSHFCCHYNISKHLLNSTWGYFGLILVYYNVYWRFELNFNDFSMTLGRSTD